VGGGGRLLRRPALPQRERASGRLEQPGLVAPHAHAGAWAPPRDSGRLSWPRERFWVSAWHAGPRRTAGPPAPLRRPMPPESSAAAPARGLINGRPGRARRSSRRRRRTWPTPASTSRAGRAARRRATARRRRPARGSTCPPGSASASPATRSTGWAGASRRAPRARRPRSPAHITRARLGAGQTGAAAFRPPPLGTEAPHSGAGGQPAGERAAAVGRALWRRAHRVRAGAAGGAGQRVRRDSVAGARARPRALPQHGGPLGAPALCVGARAASQVKP